MVGFYDSGVGGLAVLDEIIALEPDLDFIYLADTEVMPLGEKGTDFIQQRVKLACLKLFKMGCNLVVLACNTASVNSIRHIQQVWLPSVAEFKGKQVLSITKPLLELAEEEYSELKNKKGVLLATPATYQSGFYQYEFLRSGFSGLISVACPGLADAIENDKIEQVNQLLDSYLIQLNILAEEVEYVVLACTHYRWALATIQVKFPNAVIIEPSVAVAEKLIDYLGTHEFQSIKLNRDNKLKYGDSILITGNDESVKQAINQTKIRSVTFLRIEL